MKANPLGINEQVANALLYDSACFHALKIYINQVTVFNLCVKPLQNDGILKNEWSKNCFNAINWFHMYNNYFDSCLVKIC